MVIVLFKLVFETGDGWHALAVQLFQLVVLGILAEVYPKFLAFFR